MPVELIVAIPTFRRPATLQANLAAAVAQAAALAALAAPPPAPGSLAPGSPAPASLEPLRARVLVVDNDPQGSAEEVARAAGADYVVEPTPGIVAVRNRALDEAAGADLLVFIDDDEIAQPGWLAALVGTWRATGADAVWGRVVSVFDGPVDDFVAAGEFFRRKPRTTGDRVPVAACGNLLLDLATVRRLGVRFDPRMILGGGEDTLFTRTLVAGGGVIVWCDESVAHDVVPAGRANRHWVLTRQISHGNAAARVERYLAGSTGSRAVARARCVAGGGVRVAGGLARSVVGAVRRRPRDRARGLRTAARGLGLASGGLGLTYEEYARTEGWWRKWRRSVR